MELAPATVARLIELARRARSRAYAPYSRFPVGAAVLGQDGQVFLGCNVENSSFGLTICAERNAIAAAVVAESRPIAIAIAASRPDLSPCGACRQVLAEFDPEMPVVLDGGESHRVVNLGQLLPEAFHFQSE